MEKEKNQNNIKIICIKAPKWTVPFFKLFYKKNKNDDINSND